VIRLLVVDDNAAIRAAVTELCAAAGDVTVVAECIDGSGAADAARHSRPDVVLMDLSMPGTGGLAATREVLAESADARVVVLTGSFSAATVREARAIGAVGYLVKDGDPAEPSAPESSSAKVWWSSTTRTRGATPTLGSSTADMGPPGADTGAVPR
jgi:DNA-binding NarL/FixJ family response regulator